MTTDPHGRYQTLFELAPIARLVTTADGTIREANRAAVRLFDRPYQQLLGMPVDQLVLDGDRPLVARALEDANTSQPGEVVVTLRRAATPAPRAALLGVVSSPPDDPPTIQWIARDVTAEEEARASLYRALENERATAEGLRALAELRDIFLTAIAHDLRSPLAAVLNLVEVLRNRPDLDARQRADLLARVHQTATEMSALVVDLLDLTRSEHGVMPLDRSEADLGATVQRAVVETTSDSPGGPEVELDLNSLVVPVDHRLVGRIVANLMANAQQHVPADGHVWVRLRRVPEGALLTVEDDGPGIPDAVKRRVFEMFGRGDRSASLGIGLQLVRRFAELHGGWAVVEDRPGGGALFRVLIPGAPPAADGAVAAGAVPINGRGDSDPGGGDGDDGRSGDGGCSEGLSGSYP